MIFNKYNVKGTFNINTSTLDKGAETNCDGNIYINTDEKMLEICEEALKSSLKNATKNVKANENNGINPGESNYISANQDGTNESDINTFLNVIDRNESEQDESFIIKDNSLNENENKIILEEILF